MRMTNVWKKQQDLRCIFSWVAYVTLYLNVQIQRNTQRLFKFNLVVCLYDFQGNVKMIRERETKEVDEPRQTLRD